MPPYKTPWRAFFGTPVVIKMHVFWAPKFWKLKFQEIAPFLAKNGPRSELRTTDDFDVRKNRTEDEVRSPTRTANEDLEMNPPLGGFISRSEWAGRGGAFSRKLSGSELRERTGGSKILRIGGDCRSEHPKIKIMRALASSPLWGAGVQGVQDPLAGFILEKYLKNKASPA